jgi:Xaa-Pro aminopeptidase
MPVSARKPEEIDVAATLQYAANQDIAKSQEAARLAHAILDEILDFVKPGVRESEVKAHAFSLYEKHGIERPWHMPYIRFGANTLLTYRQKARDDLTLKETDIAFGDIGIVKHGIEGDAGRTIVFGRNDVFKNLVTASKDIFDEMIAFYRNNDPTGIELYEVTREVTKKRGFAFNLDQGSHLIGAFPHKGWKGGLDNWSHKMAKGVWVLEIQIRHPDLPCGAFYEDLLL